MCVCVCAHNLKDSPVCPTERPSHALVVSADVLTNLGRKRTHAFTSIRERRRYLHETPLIHAHPDQSLVHPRDQLSFPHKHVESGVSVIAEDPKGREREKKKSINNLSLSETTLWKCTHRQREVTAKQKACRGLTDTGTALAGLEFLNYLECCQQI